MNKKGFTLIEMLAVIVLLGIIAIITTPAIIDILNSSEEKKDDEQELLIENAAQRYVVDNYAKLSDEEKKCVDVSKLKNSGYFKSDSNLVGYVEVDTTGNLYDYYKNGSCANPTSCRIHAGDKLIDSGTPGSSNVTIPCNGKYKLEVWGAQGGTTTLVQGYYGGRGGYSFGIVDLTAGTKLYTYVGEQGYGSSTSSVLAGTIGNGGGTTYISSGYYFSIGGGASDIRINTDSLNSRVIVAGGGGGGGGYSTRYGQGGAGGGTSGIGGTMNDSRVNNYGTQNGSNGTFKGSFGFGATVTSSGGYFWTGGGGGGWYGGGSINAAGGGGGSGYVSSSLSNAATVAGNTSFKSPSGGNETGHSGNGYARITYCGTSSSC